MRNKNPMNRPSSGYACFSALAACAVFLFALALGRAEADYEKGVTARAAGNYEDALHEWMVTSDDPRSMTAIGSLYDYGEGFPKDDVKAAEWYAKAAEKGEYRAIAQLANFSLAGAGGVEQNPAYWRDKLEEIEGKDGYADYILASFYLGGHGGEKNLEKGHDILDALVNTRGHGQLEEELQRAKSLLSDQKSGVLDADTLVHDIKNNRIVFEETRKDRRMIVKGLINSAEQLNEYGCVLKVGTSTVQKDNVSAVFYDAPPELLTSLQPGMQVKFSGVYVGDHPFQLGDCAFTMFGCLLIDAVSGDQRP